MGCAGPMTCRHPMVCVCVCVAWPVAIPRPGATPWIVAIPSLASTRPPLCSNTPGRFLTLALDGHRQVRARTDHHAWRNSAQFRRRRPRRDGGIEAVVLMELVAFCYESCYACVLASHAGVGLNAGPRRARHPSWSCRPCYGTHRWGDTMWRRVAGSLQLMLGVGQAWGRKRWTRRLVFSRPITGQCFYICPRIGPKTSIVDPATAARIRGLLCIVRRRREYCRLPARRAQEAGPTRDPHSCAPAARARGSCRTRPDAAFLTDVWGPFLAYRASRWQLTQRTRPSAWGILPTMARPWLKSC